MRLDDAINPSPSDPPKGYPRACWWCGSDERNYAAGQVTWSDPRRWHHRRSCRDYEPRAMDLEDKAAQATLDRCPNCGEQHQGNWGGHCAVNCDCGMASCPAEAWALRELGLRTKMENQDDLPLHGPRPARRRLRDDAYRMRQYVEGEKPSDY